MWEQEQKGMSRLVALVRLLTLVSRRGLTSRTGLPEGSAGSDVLLLDHLWTLALRRHQVSVSVEAIIGPIKLTGSLRKAIDSRGRPTDMREWSQVRDA